MDEIKIFHHSLVIGGTGMLRDVSLALADRSHSVTVVARNEQRLVSLVTAARSANCNIHPVSLDYHNLAHLRSSLESAIRLYGPIDLAVVWVHQTSPEAPCLIAEIAGRKTSPCRFYHVLGSRAADPSQQKTENHRRARFTAYPNIQYHEVVLGFILENNKSRWLTNQEISQGVLKAIESGKSHYTVGTVEPWSARP
ncbi:short-chain dehydrogenase [Paenactinomyces guangxiensis]|uniref:Short-chain dehydrogenase n=1 Tax=Paenactinomyces guangxiensis TaxID=1490290 RepID=A0A7W1WPN7_9BACL|nr:short-chain dehydrogenase [Paenactinomyces guangxiensis]MBA4493747.1 short-chain dehydrogenase [Paenactinomyces guangxiensis]MBH8591035.1 short-chain dehydrogenase [Paenactinomyces guangxiensis]